MPEGIHDENLFNLRDSICSCFGDSRTCGKGVRQRVLRSLFGLLLIGQTVISRNDSRGLPRVGGPLLPVAGVLRVAVYLVTSTGGGRATISWVFVRERF